MTLFRTLCHDELHNIVRYASKTPNARQWKTRLGASDLSLLSSAHGPFDAVSTDIFRRLSLTAYHFPSHDSPTRPTFSAVDLLRSFGKHATILDIEALPNELTEVKALVEAVRENCGNVKELSVVSAVEDNKLWEPVMQGLMEGIGTQLESLTFHPLPIISERELQGAIYWITARCMNLKRFSFSAQNSSALELIQSVWYNAGNTLEDITIASRLFSPLDWAKTLAEIREHCKRVTHFRLDCNMYSKPPDDPLSEMLASYWTQLQFAGLGEMNQQRCEFVARACPNAKFSLLVTDSNINGILALGSKLSHVKIDMLEPTEPKVLGNALNTCPDLLHLDITSPCCRELAFDAPFQSEKLSLQRLSLRIRGFIIVEDTFNKVARATRELQTLSVDVASIADANAFDEVALANRKLKNVEIRTFRPIPVPVLVSILRSFLVCTSLQFIRISFKSWVQLDVRELQELTARCSFLRFRRLYVEVGRHIIHG